MTDKERIIKGLESLHDRLCDAAKQYAIATLDASMVADALALLKKQEAKPVKVSENAYGYKNYYCPNCGKWFDYKDVERKYCHRCGQEVKWDD